MLVIRSAQMQQLSASLKAEQGRRPMPFAGLPPGTTVVPCAREQEERLHWIEIQLLGDDEEPVPWERYTVRLPDGQEVPGCLDQNGFARLSALTQPGLCEVCFPDLDREAWQAIESH